MDTNKFVNRHVGISAEDIPAMLETIGVKSLDELIDQTIPANIRLKEPLNLPEAMTEREFAEHIAELASKNEVFTSYIGMGWYDTVCPAPIQRNVFENPVWYTSYTPYQAEVSQGRLEALLNFQTVISELTGLPLTNCSLLDEATAAAEAVTMFHGSRSRAQVKAEANTVFIDENVFASTLAVIHTRMIPQGIQVGPAVFLVHGQKAFKRKPPRRQTRHRQRAHRRAAARHGLHRDAVFAAEPDEILARVADGWRPGVGHEGARLPAEQAGKDRLSRRRAVVLVVAHERLFNLKMVQQLHGHARILGGDEIRAAQRLDGAGREIPEVSDGRSHQIYNSGHPDHSLSLK